MSRILDEDSRLDESNSRYGLTNDWTYDSCYFIWKWAKYVLYQSWYPVDIGCSRVYLLVPRLVIRLDENTEIFFTFCNTCFFYLQWNNPLGLIVSLNGSPYNFKCFFFCYLIFYYGKQRILLTILLLKIELSTGYALLWLQHSKMN